jgi:hypothetical protein
MKDEELDVMMITLGGEKKGMDLEHGESLSQRMKGKIIKKAQSPPKFDVAHQNKFMCDV